MTVRARRQGREEAFKLLFQVDQGVVALAEVLTLERQVNTLSPDAWGFAVELCTGTWEQRTNIDPLLDGLASGWTLARMASADRAILRLGAYELIHRLDVPQGVAINEAVELAKKYGTDDSPRFINGILGNVARQYPRADGEVVEAMAEVEPADADEEQG